MNYDDYIDFVAAYDISGRKVVKVHKHLSQNLLWEQRSVFIGEIGKSGDRQIITGLNKIINPNEDSVLLYKLTYPWAAAVERWGKLPPTKDLIG